jgi:sugar phosphate isomerase/epimerase
MPTLFELPDLKANVDLCRQLGLAFIELNMDLPMCQPDVLSVDNLKECRCRHGIDFTIHMPERLDLAAFQKDIRQGHVACATRVIDWAGQAGISKVTMHLTRGPYFTLPQQKVWLYERHWEIYLANLQASMDEMISCAAKSHVSLLIENTGNFRQGFVQEAVEMLLQRYSGKLGLTWDVGHDAESGYTDGQLIRRHLDRVALMHLHDFDGKTAHQPLFTGSIDVAAMLDLARQCQADVVIETKTVQSLTASVEALTQRR